MGNFGYIFVDLIFSLDIRLSSVSTKAQEHVYGALIVIPLFTDLPSPSENICAQLPRKQALYLLEIMQTTIFPPSRPHVAKERAQEIQRVQEQALCGLTPQSLYIALWVRDDPPPPDNFHWAFYYHEGSKGGTIYQVKGLGDGWIADHGIRSCIFKSLFLCGLVQIGKIPATKGQELDYKIRSRDSALNEIPNVTCKVWLFEVFLGLVQQGLVRCENSEALKNECLAFGNKFRFEASNNVQPRPVALASTCS